MNALRRLPLWSLFALAAAALACAGLGRPAELPGQLAAGDVVNRNLAAGETARWTFSGSHERLVTITAVGNGFAIQFEVQNKSGTAVVQAQAAAPGEAAEIVGYAIPADGDYVIVVSGSASGSGPYTLSLSNFPAASNTPGGQLAYGDLVRDMLSDADGDAWTFDGLAGDRVHLFLHGEGFNPNLKLFGPDGALLAEDAGSGPGPDAFIEGFVLPASGTYRVIVNSVQPGSRGLYTLGLTLAAAAVSAVPDTPGGFLRYDQAVRDIVSGDEPDRWVFSGEAGDELTISLYSAEFDPRLELLNQAGASLFQDDDTGPGQSALIQGFRLPEAGEYTIAAGRRGAQGGEYLLYLVLSRPAVAAGTPGGPIAYGDTVTDAVSNTQGDTWTFTAAAGDRVTIRLTGDGFDTVLELYGPDRSLLIQDDDGGGGLNSLIQDFRLALAGEYRIVARGLGSETGSYTLSLELGEPPAERGALLLGQTVTDTLTTPAGAAWTFAGQAGITVSVVLNSGDFDPAMELYGPDGEMLASDDDGGLGTNALLQSIELPAAGDYALHVRGFGGGTGSYTLTLIEGAFVIAGDTPGGTITVGQTVTDLVTTDLGDQWTFSAQAGDFVTIALNSSDFDTYLQLHGPGGVRAAADDDSGPDLNALLENVRLQVTGVYTISARSFSGASGAYTLTLSAGTPIPASGHLRYGDTVTHEVTSASGDWWTFDGAAGDRITIALDSSAFDTFLELYGPDGAQLAFDDDSGPDLNSLIAGFTLPTAGTYIIIAKAYAGEGGPYTLSLTRASAGAGPPPAWR
jgi:hypothetical protein